MSEYSTLQPHSNTPRRNRRLTLTREPLPKIHYQLDSDQTPFESSHILPILSGFGDEMALLARNMNELSRIHTVISQTFNESFAAFIYGLSITMWCTDFPYMPLKSDWDELLENAQTRKRIELVEARLAAQRAEEQRLQELVKELDESVKKSDLNARPRQRQFISPIPGRIHPSIRKAPLPVVKRNAIKPKPHKVMKP